MECSGNSRRGFAPITPGTQFRNGTVASVEWSGVSLSTLLDLTGLRSEVRNIAIMGADGTDDEHFSKGLPLGKARDPNTILAFEMNGVAIPHLHGGPVRLIVPGWYGVWSVKWVTQIDALDHDFDGYWQRERYIYKWSDGRPTSVVATLGVKSVISEPIEDSELRAGRHRVAGYAWSSGPTITAVDVRINDGEWRNANIIHSEQEYGWARWEFAWDAGPGRYALMSRATDALGNQQPEIPPWNFLGYANNAVQTVVVDVAF
jgi:hypothetical protein